jgi:hypothetical protein
MAAHSNGSSQVLSDLADRAGTLRAEREQSPYIRNAIWLR